MYREHAIDRIHQPQVWHIQFVHDINVLRDHQVDVAEALELG